MGKLIYLIASLFFMICLILIISIFSVFGLHAKVPHSEFYVPPNKDIYECKLQWIHENQRSQFFYNEKPLLTCVYKCEDTHGTFEWYEKSWDQKGCKIKTRVYKTELG